MSTYETLLFEVRDRVGFVTLNRPDRLNAINLTMRMELDRLFDSMALDDEVLSVIVTGTGKAFSAGGDIQLQEQEQRMAATRKYSKEDRLAGHPRIAWCPKPVIAAINGYAMGGGLELALCCDIRLAASTAKMGLPEVNLGVLPGSGGTQRLPRLIGTGLALEMILTGKRVTAEEACRIGLVNSVYPPEELLGAAESLAREIAAKPPLAVRLIKEAVLRGTQQLLEDGLRHERNLMYMLFDTEDRKEGMQAFLEKRAPEWKGR